MSSVRKAYCESKMKSTLLKVIFLKVFIKSQYKIVKKAHIL